MGAYGDRIILIIILFAVVAGALYLARSGTWLMRRHIGETCPRCNGIGSTGDEVICSMCRGRRVILVRRRRG